MLPTEKASHIYLNIKTNKLGYVTGEYPEDLTQFPQKDLITQNQHLYILSDEEIKEGDWFYHTNLKIVQHKEFKSTGNINKKKIIATTNESLEIVPKIPQDFIKEYCGLGGIDEVLIKYKPSYWEEISNKSFHIEEHIVINSDNTITIKQIKESWNRQEVENLLRKFNDENNTLFLKSEKEQIVETFIKSNL